MRAWLLILACSWAMGSHSPARADELPEYRLKAAFLYNFAVFTEWPADVGPTLNLCVYGNDPFGAELEFLQSKKVGERALAIARRATLEGLRQCQLVFIAASAAEQTARVVETLRGQPVLTVADSPSALARGVCLNLHVVQGRVAFEASLKAARAARLGFSSRLLKLATEVVQ